jgi:hypothetical protein
MRCRRHKREKPCQECKNEYNRRWRRRRKKMVSSGVPVPVLAEPMVLKPGEAREGTSENATTVSGVDSGGGHLLAHVSSIPVNPRLCSVRLGGGEEVEVVVGRNERLWLGCPLLVRQSFDYPGFYEVVGELPRGRWDRAYLEGFK